VKCKKGSQNHMEWKGKHKEKIRQKGPENKNNNTRKIGESRVGEWEHRERAV